MNNPSLQKIVRFRDSTMNRPTGRTQSYECEDVGGILSDFMNAKLQEPYAHRNVECIGLTLRQKMLLLHQPPTSKPQHRRLWNTGDRLDTLMAATDNIADIPTAGLATIAQAGFFHSGTDNTLTCFFCGCHAHGWSVDDDPWRRHAELQMTCPVLCRNVYTQIKDGSIAYRPRTRHFSDSGASPPPASYTRTLH